MIAAGHIRTLVEEGPRSLGEFYARAKEIIQLVCTNLFISRPGARGRAGAEVGKMKFRTNPRGSGLSWWAQGTRDFLANSVRALTLVGWLMARFTQFNLMKRMC